MAPKGKKVSNTVRNAVDSRSRGGIRPRIRGSLGNNMVLRGNEMLENLIIPATQTDHSLGYPLIAGVTVARDAVIFSGVARCFQQYKYLPGTALHYQPAVGLNTSGTIYAAYFDNPEMISDWNSLGTVARVSRIKANASVKCFPVWQEFRIPISGTPRLKMFSTDISTTYNVDDLTRTCQGLFAVAIDGVTANATATQTIGRCVLETVLQLEGLSNPTN